MSVIRALPGGGWDSPLSFLQVSKARWLVEAVPGTAHSADPGGIEGLVAPGVGLVDRVQGGLAPVDFTGNFSAFGQVLLVWGRLNVVCQSIQEGDILGNVPCLVLEAEVGVDGKNLPVEVPGRV